MEKGGESTEKDQVKGSADKMVNTANDEKKGEVDDWGIPVGDTDDKVKNKELQ